MKRTICVLAGNRCVCQMKGIYVLQLVHEQFVCLASVLQL